MLHHISIFHDFFLQSTLYCPYYYADVALYLSKVICIPKCSCMFVQNDLKKKIYIYIFPPFFNFTFKYTSE